MTRDDLIRLVAAALREDHCSTKQRARIIVTVRPESAAASAVDALVAAGVIAGIA